MDYFGQQLSLVELSFGSNLEQIGFVLTKSHGQIECSFAIQAKPKCIQYGQCSYLIDWYLLQKCFIYTRKDSFAKCLIIN